jgi:hypothetical protein
MSITIDRYLNNSKAADLKQKPQIRVNVNIMNFNFNISAQQLSIVLKTVMNMAKYGSYPKRYEMRPVEQNSKQWMQYLFGSLSEDVPLNKELLQKNEYMSYMKHFCTHYINSNTKEG